MRPTRFRLEKFASGLSKFGTPSKIVCVAKNYSLLENERSGSLDMRIRNASIFMKPASSLVPMDKPVYLNGASDIVGETEMAILISREVPTSSSVLSDEFLTSAIGGVGLALDLTKKLFQNDLKAQGRPWELSKGFDGACPISKFLETDQFPERVTLMVNGELVLDQPLSDMIIAPLDLMRLISRHCSLWPGDIILTGTPTAPKPPPTLRPGDVLEAKLGNLMCVNTNVV